MRRVHYLVAGFITGSALHVGAQQVVGQAFNPRVSPGNPDIVAFERLDGDRLELQFRRLSSGLITSALRVPAAKLPDEIGLPGASNAGRLSAFSGDLDWRVPTSDARQWFAYVASHERGLSLFVNYLDRAGNLAATDPLRIPFTGSVHRPRWSPDGKHIAFVSDSSVLHVLWNVASVLQSRNVAGLRATRITQAGTPALFPAWSPGGDYIAYQVERTIRGAKRFAIDVIQVDLRTASISGAPTTVTEALDENAYRPSWSPDAKYIAFYSSRLGAPPAESRGTTVTQSLDIGLVELQRSPTTQRVFRGQLVQGRSRKIGENVIANESRGPEWTRISVGGTPQPAIVLVQLDQARNNPIVFVGVQPWLDMRARAEFETSAPASWATVNHKDVSAAEFDNNVRYVYVSVGGGGQNIQSKDAPATWAKATATVAVLAEPEVVASAQPGGATVSETQTTQGPRVTTRDASLGMALIFPGGAQWASGRKGKAALFTIAGVGGAVVGLLGAAGTHSAVKRANDVPNGSKQFDEAESDFNSKKSLAIAGGGAAAVAWLLGIVDAAMSRSSSSRALTFELSPARGRVENRRDPGLGVEARVGFSLPLRTPSR